MWSILDTAHEAFVSMDAAGRITGWNQAAQRTFGYSREDVEGRELAETIVPERYRAKHREGMARFLATGEHAVLDQRLELWALHRDGCEFPIEITIACGGDAGDTGDAWDVGAFWALADDGVLELVAGWTSGNVDASEFEPLSRQLRLEPGAGLPGQALERREPVWIQDYAGDPGMLRARAARTAGLHAAICVPATREGEVVGTIEFFSREVRVCDRAIVGALSTVGGHGELLGVLDERHALLRRLETLALTDQLTGLPNRRAWEEALNRELSRAARDRLPVCVAVLDIDGFKRHNDEFGHLAGDGPLHMAAAAWRAELRGGDVWPATAATSSPR